MKIMAMMLALALATPATAQVYKCTVNGTTTYSQQPCGRDAQQVDVPDAPKLDPHELDMRAAARQRMDAERDAREQAQQRAACVDRLSYTARSSTEQQIEQAQAEINVIGTQRVYYNPRSVSQSTYAQTFTNGQNARIAALQASIDSAKLRRTQAIASARETCAAQRRSGDH